MISSGADEKIVDAWILVSCFKMYEGDYYFFRKIVFENISLTQGQRWFKQLNWLRNGLRDRLGKERVQN